MSLNSILRSKDNEHLKKVVIIEMKTGALLIISIAILIFPFFIHHLFVRNYSNEYAAWQIGGFPYEVWNQLGYLGALCCLILLFGLVFGLFDTNLNQITVISFLGLILTMYAFTRIQNMGKHQALCLFPYYFVFLENHLIMINRIRKHSAWKRIGIIITLLVFSLNAASTVLGWYDSLDGVSLLTKYAIASRFTWRF